MNFKIYLKKSLLIRRSYRLALGWYAILKNKFLHNFVRGYLNFVDDYLKFKKLNERSARFSLSWRDRRPHLNEKISTSNFDRHYVYHTAWAARVLAKTKPKFHTDISSTIYFCSIVSAFIPVKFYEYRMADLKLNNLSQGFADLLSLPFQDNSIASLSCMHTVEHIGLGRYGDPLDPDGDLKAAMELERVLSVGGDLLFVAPIGKPKLAFNAHRIYSHEQITAYFSKLKLEEFALIPDDVQDGGLVYNPRQELIERQRYGCGCFWFKKM